MKIIKEIKEGLLKGNLENVVGVIFNTIPMDDGTGKLAFSIDAFRKADSKVMGKIYIRLEDLMSDLVDKKELKKKGLI